jgi:hypothetical protein
MASCFSRLMIDTDVGLVLLAASFGLHTYVSRQLSRSASLSRQDSAGLLIQMLCLLFYWITMSKQNMNVAKQRVENFSNCVIATLVCGGLESTRSSTYGMATLRNSPGTDIVENSRLGPEPTQFSVRCRNAARGNSSSPSAILLNLTQNGKWKTLSSYCRHS